MSAAVDNNDTTSSEAGKVAAAGKAVDNKSPSPKAAEKPKQDTSNGKHASASKSADQKHSTAGKKTKIAIEFTADTVCPWCFVGHRRLQKALGNYDEKKFDVTFRYHPYILAPDMKESLPKLQHYLNKFKTTPEKIAEKNDAMAKKGEEQAGIKFKFGGNVGPTLNSHRLLQWALKSGKQEKLLEVLNSYYFEQEKDISDVTVLVAAAAAVGLNSNDAKAFLESKELAEVVSKESNAARDSDDIETVPYITINGKRAADGSQTDFAALLVAAVKG